VSKEEEDDTISNKEDEIMLWEEHFIATKLINITT
jgi:hypothetical protein